MQSVGCGINFILISVAALEKKNLYSYKNLRIININAGKNSQQKAEITKKRLLQESQKFLPKLYMQYQG